MTDINKNGDHGGRRFDEALAIQYLFGELSEAKKEEFEESYFDDDAFFERFLAVKNELLDLYARDELEPAVSTRMERAFLISDSRQNRIAETRDFIRSISTVADRDLIGSLPLEISGGKSGFLESIASFFSVPRFAGLAILLFGALGGIWLLLSPRENANLIGLNTPANSGQLNSDQDVSVRPGMSNTDSPSENLLNQNAAINSQPTEHNANANPSPSPKIYIRETGPMPVPPELAVKDSTEKTGRDRQAIPKPDAVAGNETEFVTLDDSTRSITSRNTASIGTSTRTVIMRLLFSGPPFPTYAVRITTVSGAIVWQKGNLRAPMSGAAKTLTVSIPASTLAGKDYIVILDGLDPNSQTETIHEYYFRVERSERD